MRNLVVNATDARRQFFSLFDMAVAGTEVTITKNNTDSVLILKKKENISSQKEIEANLVSIKETYGAIKTSGYKSDEFEIAKENFIKKYKRRLDDKI